jgi:ABC-type uncharacterized transport system permease subunit
MNAETLSWISMLCFLAGAVIAILAFRVESLRSNFLQVMTAGMGVALKTAAIGLACKENSHFFSSPAEMLGLLAWSLGFSYLVILSASAARSLGVLIMPTVALLSLISFFVSHEAQVIDVPHSSLFTLHVLFAFLGYGLFLTACGASILYLEQASMLKRKVFGVIFRDLPSLQSLERLEILCAWLGLALFSGAIVLGAILASRYGRAFFLEPKFLAAQMTWLIFLLLVIGRMARLLSGRMAAKCVLIGAMLILLTLALGHPPEKISSSHSPVPVTKKEVSA